MAEKKILSEECPCGEYVAEVYIDVEAKSKRLDFVEKADAPKPKPAPRVEKSDEEKEFDFLDSVGL